MGMDAGALHGAGVATDPDLDRAISALARTRPAFSARRRLTAAQGIAFAAAAAAFALGAAAEPGLMRTAAYVLFVLSFSTFVSIRIVAALATASPPPVAARRWEGALPVYSVLCPVYREAGMLAGLLQGIANLDYPSEKLDVLLVLEADDSETIAAVRKLGLPSFARVALVPPAGPRTKPKALNYALCDARGAFVAVFDAEDVPHPQQLRAALDAFAAGGLRLGCVQAPLVIDNAGQSWLARQFAAEYAIHFGQIAPLFARLGLPFPLGGAANHFRREALEAAGAWDPYNVTEDADLGYRLARDGWRCSMIAPATLETAPIALWPWLRQRSRWIKGHVHTWLVLMRDPVRTARELGLAGFVAMQAQLGGSILAAFAHGPLLVLACMAALGYGAFTRADIALLACGFASAAWGAVASALLARDARLALAAFTMPFYWPLSTVAALMAVFDFAARPHYWAKTDHHARPPGTCSPQTSAPP